MNINFFKSMNMKQLILIGLVLLLLAGLVGCDKESQITDSEKLCPYLNIENINKTREN